MGLRNLFKGKSYRQHEEKGDTYAQAQDYGRARLEYESALNKLGKHSEVPDDIDEIRKQLRTKLQDCQEALARGHKQTGDDLLESGYDQDARQYYELALSLSANETLKSELLICLEKIKEREVEEIEEELDGREEYIEENFASEIIDQGDEYFEALCNALPDDIRRKYMGYGDSFAQGYIALNRGDFKTAITELEQACKENPDPDSYISLELGTAYLNLGNHEKAIEIVEGFLRNHPDILPAYQIVCEAYWAEKDFDRAESLLDSIPHELKESTQFYLLKGETLFYAGKHKEAQAFYANFLKEYGWNEQIALARAGLHESLGETEQARDIYGEVLSQCSSCGQQVSPLIKQKYADLSLLTGQYSTRVLELYFSLVQDNPVNAGQYYQKISRIYELQGNDEEAHRFELIARKYL
jgi:tetratricopeptide (TPR) repeat protein